MNVIKFSNNYPKLWGQKNAKLVFIEHIFEENFPLNKDLIEYDTKTSEGKYYPLPRGDYLQLIFIGNKRIPFCTIRRYTPEKYAFYNSKLYEHFEIKIE